MSTIIRVWFKDTWREAEVVQVMHDTVQVYEPDSQRGVVWNVGRSDINPNDLYLVPIPACRVKSDTDSHKWEWYEVESIGNKRVMVQHPTGLRYVYRDDIHPEDNRLMPPPTFDPQT